MQTHKTYTLAEATAKMMRFCAYRERCHKEVEEKLTQMRMIPEAQQEIIYKLIQENFLNETRFAKSFVRGKFRIKKWGKIRLKRELKARNISSFNITIALKEINEKEYLKTFYTLLQKRQKSLSEKNPLKLKKKIADYLLYRGWESSLVYDALRELDE